MTDSMTDSLTDSVIQTETGGRAVGVSMDGGWDPSIDLMHTCLQAYWRSIDRSMYVYVCTRVYVCD